MVPCFRLQLCTGRLFFVRLSLMRGIRTVYTQIAMLTFPLSSEQRLVSDAVCTADRPFLFERKPVFSFCKTRGYRSRRLGQ